jgi:hypothetical protein
LKMGGHYSLLYYKLFFPREGKYVLNEYPGYADHC